MLKQAVRVAGGASIVCGAVVAANSASCEPFAEEAHLGDFVRGFAIARYSANNPVEDRFFIDSTPEYAVFGVLDGHGGDEMAEFASTRLPAVLKNLLAESPSVEQGLRESFLALDSMWAQLVRSPFRLGFGNVARAGACGLVAVRTKDELVIANAGDCRAVLVRAPTGSQKCQATTPPLEQGEGATSSTGALEALAAKSGVARVERRARAFGAQAFVTAPAAAEGVAVTKDHSANSKEEQARLAREHPGEPNIVVCKHEKACYVKGMLMPTRCFGDLYLKSPEFNNGNPMVSRRGRAVREGATFPYISADPDVFHVDTKDENAVAVVLATDGLWDELGNAEVAAIVAECGQTPDGRRSAAQALLQRALDRAARQGGMSTKDLLALSPGRQRRRVHDDITVTVVWLK